MLRTRRFVTALAGLAIAGLVAGCTTLPAAVPSAAPSPSPTVSPLPSGDGVFTVGTLFPVTGAQGFIAPAQVAGVNLAVKDINAAGGVLGKPVVVVHADSGEAKEKKLEASFKSLIDKKADVIIGPSSSVLAERILPAAIEAGIPIVSPAATAPRLSELPDDGMLFRTISSAALQGEALARVASAAVKAAAEKKAAAAKAAEEKKAAAEKATAEKADGEKAASDKAAAEKADAEKADGKKADDKKPDAEGARLAVIYFDDDTGRATAATATATVAALGGKLVASEKFAAGTKSFTGILDTVKAAKPDAVILASPFSAMEQNKTLIRALTTAKLGKEKLWLTGGNLADYSQALPAGTLTGVRGVIEGTEPSTAFQKRVKEAGKKVTDIRYAAEAYDAVMLAALAAIAEGNDSGLAVARSLTDVSSGGIKCLGFIECLAVLATQDDIDYDGVSGPVNLTQDGDPHPVHFGVYKYDAKNKFARVDRVVAG